MTLDQALAKLEALGDERVRQQNAKRGCGDNQFGVRLGDIRKLAKQIGRDHELGAALWERGNVEGRLLAILLMKPRSLTADALDRMVRSLTFVGVADWLVAYVAKKHPDKEALRLRWMAADDRWAARAGWALTAERAAKDAADLDLPALLDRIEAELADAAPEVQWTMNMALVEIGIHHPGHRDRALAIGERLGLYRDHPVAKGCTSPFAPTWITAMVARQD